MLRPRIPFARIAYLNRCYFLKYPLRRGGTSLHPQVVSCPGLQYSSRPQQHSQEDYVNNEAEAESASNEFDESGVHTGQVHMPYKSATAQSGSNAESLPNSGSQSSPRATNARRSTIYPQANNTTQGARSARQNPAQGPWSGAGSAASQQLAALTNPRFAQTQAMSQPPYGAGNYYQPQDGYYQPQPNLYQQNPYQQPVNTNFYQATGYQQGIYPPQPGMYQQFPNPPQPNMYQPFPNPPQQNMYQPYPEMYQQPPYPPPEHLPEVPMPQEQMEAQRSAAQANTPNDEDGNGEDDGYLLLLSPNSTPASKSSRSAASDKQTPGPEGKIKPPSAGVPEQGNAEGGGRDSSTNGPVSADRQRHKDFGQPLAHPAEPATGFESAFESPSIPPTSSTISQTDSRWDQSGIDQSASIQGPQWSPPAPLTGLKTEEVSDATSDASVTSTSGAEVEQRSLHDGPDSDSHPVQATADTTTPTHDATDQPAANLGPLWSPKETDPDNAPSSGTLREITLEGLGQNDAGAELNEPVTTHESTPTASGSGERVDSQRGIAQIETAPEDDLAPDTQTTHQEGIEESASSTSDSNIMNNEDFMGATLDQMFPEEGTQTPAKKSKGGRSPEAKNTSSTKKQKKARHRPEIVQEDDDISAMLDQNFPEEVVSSAPRNFESQTEDDGINAMLDYSYPSGKPHDSNLRSNQQTQPPPEGVAPGSARASESGLGKIEVTRETETSPTQGSEVPVFRRNAAIPTEKFHTFEAAATPLPTSGSYAPSIPSASAIPPPSSSGWRIAQSPSSQGWEAARSQQGLQSEIQAVQSQAPIPPSAQYPPSSPYNSQVQPKTQTRSPPQLEDRAAPTPTSAPMEPAQSSRKASPESDKLNTMTEDESDTFSNIVDTKKPTKSKAPEDFEFHPPAPAASPSHFVSFAPGHAPKPEEKVMFYGLQQLAATSSATPETSQTSPRDGETTPSPVAPMRTDLSLKTSYSNPEYAKRMRDILVEANSRDPDPAAVFKLVKQLARRGFAPTVEVYSILTGVLAKQEDRVVYQHLASGLLDELKSEGLRANSTIYHNLLKILAVSPDFITRDRILNEMAQQWIPLTQEGVECVIFGLLTDGQFERALEIYDTRRANQSGISLAVYTEIIKALGRASEVDEAIRVGREAIQDFDKRKITMVWYELLNVTASSLNLEGTLWVWQSAVEQGEFNPDDGVCLKVLNTAARGGSPQLAGHALRRLSDRGVKINEGHYNALITAFARGGNLPMAFRTVQKIREAGIIPTSTTSSAIADAITADGKIEAVDAAYFALKDRHNEASAAEPNAVDIIAFNAVIEACVRLNDMERALGVYNDAAGLGLLPSTETFNLLFIGCLGGYWYERVSPLDPKSSWSDSNPAPLPPQKELAMFLAGEMKTAGKNPDSRTYESLLQASLYQDNYEDAFMYLEEMKGMHATIGRVRPLVYQWIGWKLFDEGDERIEMLLDEMVEVGYGVEASGISKLLVDRSMKRAGQDPQAQPQSPAQSQQPQEPQVQPAQGNSPDQGQSQYNPAQQSRSDAQQGQQTQQSQQQSPQHQPHNQTEYAAQVPDWATSQQKTPYAHTQHDNIMVKLQNQS